MTRTLDAIDISDKPELLQLVNELRATGGTLALRRGDEDVAVLTLVGAAGSSTRPALTESERAAFLATAGGWSGIVDADEFKAKNAESRRIPPRPRVAL